VADVWIAAKAALRRKKQFEHSLEQTSSQIMTLEREIYSIETANINKETLDAMKNAGTAMKQIHAGLTIDKVDNVMFVSPNPSFPPPVCLNQDSLTLVSLQGRSPRTTRHRRRNQRSHHLRRHIHRHRRRRTRRRARRAAAGETRRRHA
jgi:hypothetical protein